MNKIIPIAAGAIVVLIGLIVFLQNPTLIPQKSDTVEQKTSIYVTTNALIKQKLAEQQIQMSSPIKLGNKADIEKYCTFFTSEEKQKLVEYCTSTELKDEKGTFLGNIHMVGSTDEPKIILALIQTDNSTSHLDDVKKIFSSVSDVVVCDCWAEKKPGGLNNIDQWVDGLYAFHHTNTKQHSKSNTLSFEGKSLQLELTQNKDGYLWQFYIYN
jgi:hypothetical protein